MSITITISNSSLSVTNPSVILSKATAPSANVATSTSPSKINIEVTLNSKSLI